MNKILLKVYKDYNILFKKNRVARNKVLVNKDNTKLIKAYNKTYKESSDFYDSILKVMIDELGIDTHITDFYIKILLTQDLGEKQIKNMLNLSKEDREEMYKSRTTYPLVNITKWIGE